MFLLAILSTCLPLKPRFLPSLLPSILFHVYLMSLPAFVYSIFKSLRYFEILSELTPLVNPCVGSNPIDSFILFTKLYFPSIYKEIKPMNINMWYPSTINASNPLTVTNLCCFAVNVSHIANNKQQLSPLISLNLTQLPHLHNRYFPHCFRLLVDPHDSEICAWTTNIADYTVVASLCFTA